MIASASDVFEICRFAEERRIGNPSPEHPYGFNISDLLALGLPPVTHTTNSHLEALRPMYIDLLNRSGVGSPYERMFRDILNNKDASRDAAAVLIYLLTFPFLVFSARTDILGLAGCKSDEDFPLRMVHKKIKKDKRLARWCRGAIRLAPSTSHHSGCVLYCSVVLLLHRSEDKKLNTIVLQGRSFDDEFRDLYNDLGELFGRRMVSDYAVSHCLKLLFNLARTEKGGNENFRAFMKSFQGTSAHQFLLQALGRVRGEIGEGLYHFCRIPLFPDPSIGDLLLVKSTCDRALNNSPNIKMIETCSVNGCTKVGTHTCSRCRLVKYCSKDCQVAHWRYHKIVCRKPEKKG